MRGWRGILDQVRAAAPEDGEKALDGFGEGLSEVGLGRGVAGKGEGNGGVEADEGAEHAAGVGVGDAAGAVFEEGAEEEKDGGGDLLRGEGGEVGFEVAPALKAGGGLAEGAGFRLRGMAEAEDVGGGGAAAAALSVSEEMTAFHGVLGQ